MCLMLVPVLLSDLGTWANGKLAISVLTSSYVIESSEESFELPPIAVSLYLQETVTGFRNH